MLEAISDFWKPMKKNQNAEKPNPEQLQLGSSIGFGFVPQASISGRRLQVIGINTYRFGDDSLTSFVLGQDKEPAASMIVAEAEGEHYLAISRRITISDRMKMFDSKDLENIMDKPDVSQLPCKDGLSDFKGWTVPSYKREIQGMKGALYKGDFRKTAIPSGNDAQNFTYTLLVSETNEHAIEIEKYNDGRVEMYATVYRRMSDIGEITHPTPGTLDRPDIKLASDTGSKPVAQEAPKPEAPKMETKPVEAAKAAEPVKAEPVVLKEFVPASVTPPETKPQMTAKPVEAPMFKRSDAQTAAPTEFAAAQSATKPAPQAPAFKANEGAPKVQNAVVQPTAPATYFKQEIKTVSNVKNGLDNEAIECDLRVANKIIDEAIRNEMRLSDIVRRIIELPVAYPEAVQIPITLSDEDYALLAIRYSITPSDRNAIKLRILEDLNDFSGSNGQQQKKAA